MLHKEEMSLNDTFEKLENEKLHFIKEYKRQFEEDHSRYGKNNGVGIHTWPILGDRY